MEKGKYVLSGALAVQDDLDAEQIDRVSRHLGGIATVYLAHDDVAHSVAICISGTMSPDDMRIVEKRVEKFAEEYCSAGAILLSEWNGLTSWLVVGMKWQAQCLIKLGAVQEQFSRLAERDLDFLVRLEPSGPLAHGSPLMCVSVETDDRQTNS
jgi:hypothetical protein